MPTAYPTAIELRRTNLATLVRSYGSQRALADVVGVAAAQISQWITAAPDAKTGRPRSISDESARAIEQSTGRPAGWMDHDHRTASPTHSAPALTLESALPVLLGRLPGLSSYRASQVLHALQAATQPGADLEQIERDLLQWLSEPRQPTQRQPETPAQQTPARSVSMAQVYCFPPCPASATIKACRGDRPSAGLQCITGAWGVHP